MSDNPKETEKKEPETPPPQETPKVEPEQKPEPEAQGSDIVEFICADGQTRPYTKLQLNQLAQIKEQELRDDVEKKKEPETSPEELTVEQRLENAEKRIQKQENDTRDKDYRDQTLSALNKLNEDTKLSPKAKKLVDMQTVAMLRGGSADIVKEHASATLLFKEAIEEYNDDQKKLAMANHKVKIFTEAGAGLKSSGGLPQIEPNEAKTAEHVKSGAAYENMSALLREMAKES